LYRAFILKNVCEIMLQPHCIMYTCSRGVLPYMGYIGMCGPKGYGFSAVFVTLIGYVFVL